MGNSNIKQHVETAQKTGACQLCKLGLKEVPEDLQSLKKNLRTLDLSSNKLPDLPPWIVQFSVLKGLILANNKLSSLPEEIGSLKKLEVLSLEQNLLTRLPPSIGCLSSLKTLNVSGNRLREFPREVCQLRNLEFINLAGNAITKLPEDMGDLQAVELVLNQNQLSTLPESIAACPRLKVLRLQENCLSVNAFGPRVMRESQISLFDVEGNVFDTKAFHNVDGYDAYMERFTATKKKFN